MELKLECEKNIRAKILNTIKTKLTIGRTDNDLSEIDDDNIIKFIADNEHKIKNIITNMINDYEKNGELEQLINPENDWVNEYMDEMIGLINALTE
jgi:hypothetical protein